MQRRRVGGWLAAIIALAVAGTAGALEIDLEYDAPKPQVAGGLVVAVTFENARPADEGGDDLSRVCTVRSLAGIPWELHTASEHVDTVIPRYIADALRAAGYDARVEADPALPTVHVRLDDLWCAGHVHYETYITATIQVFPAGTATPAWEDTLVAKEGVTLNWGFKEMAGGYEKMFHSGFGQLATMFGSGAFQRALSPAPAEVGEPAVTAPPPAPGGPLPGEDAAADIVGLYYVYQGTTADAAAVAAGVEAAMTLFDAGHSEEVLRKVVVRVHQEIPGAQSAAFEIIVPAYARAHAAEMGASAAPTPVATVSEPVVEPAPVVDAVAAPDPPPPEDAEMPDVLPDPEMPDVLPDPEERKYEDPIEDDVITESQREEHETDEDAGFGRSDRVVEKTATVHGPRKPVPRAARTAMGIGGGALIGGGMLGGVLLAVSCGNVSGYTDQGGIPALGLVPLAGPAIVHGYWSIYGTYRFIKPYEGTAALLTALEITGAALIVVAIALPKAPPGAMVRRTPLWDVVLVPSLAPGAGGLQLHGRF